MQNPISEIVKLIFALYALEPPRINRAKNLIMSKIHCAIKPSRNEQNEAISTIAGIIKKESRRSQLNKIFHQSFGAFMCIIVLHLCTEKRMKNLCIVKHIVKYFFVLIFFQKISHKFDDNFTERKNKTFVNILKDILHD